MRNSLFHCLTILWIGALILGCQSTTEKEDSSSGDKESTEKTEKAQIMVKSPAFQDGETIPKKYCCKAAGGKDISPELQWEGVPEGTESITIIMDDPDAPEITWVHWVLYNLPPDVRKLPTNVTPDNIEYESAKHGNNNFEQRKYGGPCPPPGHGVHQYHFKVYAVDKKLDYEAGLSKDKVKQAMKGHIIGKGELVGTFERKED